MFRGFAGDERIELPPKVLETPIIPFDQSPVWLSFRKLPGAFRTESDYTIASISVQGLFYGVIRNVFFVLAVDSSSEYTVFDPDIL